MQTFRNKIKNLDNKVIFLYFFISMISLKTAYSLRKQIYDSGYHFLFFFFLISPLFIYFIIFMLRLVYQLEGPPRSPFYLLKYSIYFMILLNTALPFFYLWGMRDLIYHLKWQVTIFKAECKNEPNLFGSFLFILYLCAIIKKPLMAANRESRTPRW